MAKRSQSPSPPQRTEKKSKTTQEEVFVDTFDSACLFHLPDVLVSIVRGYAREQVRRQFRITSVQYDFPWGEAQLFGPQVQDREIVLRGQFRGLTSEQEEELKAESKKIEAVNEWILSESHLPLGEQTQLDVDWILVCDKCQKSVLPQKQGLLALWNHRSCFDYVPDYALSCCSCGYQNTDYMRLPTDPRPSIHDQRAGSTHCLTLARNWMNDPYIMDDLQYRFPKPPRDHTLSALARLLFHHDLWRSLDYRVTNPKSLLPDPSTCTDKISQPSAFGAVCIHPSSEANFTPCPVSESKKKKRVCVEFEKMLYALVHVVPFGFRPAWSLLAQVAESKADPMIPDAMESKKYISYLRHLSGKLSKRKKDRIQNTHASMYKRTLADLIQERDARELDGDADHVEAIRLFQCF